MSPRQQLFTIQQVSRKLDIPKSTLRYWEKEFDGVLAPVRTSGGQRRYTGEDIKTLSRIYRLKKEGMSLNEVKSNFIRRLEDRSTYPQSEYINLFADRVSKLVKEEVYRFLIEDFNFDFEMEK